MHLNLSAIWITEQQATVIKSSISSGIAQCFTLGLMFFHTSEIAVVLKVALDKKRNTDVTSTQFYALIMNRKH